MTRKVVALVSWYSDVEPDSGERVRLASLRREMDKHFETVLVCIDGDPRISDRDMALHASIAKPYVITRRTYLRAILRGRAIEQSALGGRAVRAEVGAVLKSLKPDVIVANQPWTFPLVPVEMLDRTILDTHNINSARLERLMLGMRVSDPRRQLLRSQIAAAARFERQYVEQAGQVWTVSADDRERLPAEARSKIFVIPNGAHFGTTHLDRTHQAVGVTRVLFFGSLNYSANIDGLRNLKRWVGERDEFPEVRITVAGSGGTGVANDIVGGDSRFEVIGRVSSTQALYQSHDCLIVPLRFGGGSRLKVIEAMANRLPILSTSVGVEGVALQKDVHYVEVNDGKSLEDGVSAIRDFDRSSRMTDAAYELGRASLDWEVLGTQVASLMNRISGGA